MMRPNWNRPDWMRSNWMRPNWLDPLVERFQHGWETNPRFRSIATGVAGSLLVVLLCASMVGAATFAGSLNNSLNGSSSVYVNSVSGGKATPSISFPLTTLTPWPNPNIPDGYPLPSSLTPMPTATNAPTATPRATCDTNCGPGGGSGKILLVSVAPPTITNSTAITVTVETTLNGQPAGEQVRAKVTWPNHAYAEFSGATDGTTGLGTISLGMPSGCPGSIQIILYDSSGASTGATAKCS